MSDVKLHNVQIHMTGPGRGTVKVDGVAMKCSEVTFNASSGEANVVTLRLIAGDVEIIADASVRATLRAMGAVSTTDSPAQTPTTPASRLVE